MPMTWVGWGVANDPNFDTSRLGFIYGDLEFIKDPQYIAKFGGYGVDGDGDGIADPWNLQDAIFSAAHYLSKNGYKSGDESSIRNALYHYNKDSSYVSQVYNRGEMFQGNMATGDVGPQVQMILDAAMTWVGNSRYVLGGGRTEKDIQNKICDCSSFVRWAFAEGGYDFGKPGNTSTQTIKTHGRRISLDEMIPGDLIFWDTMSYSDSHVGIYIGSGKWVGCNTSSGVAVTNVDHPAYWNSKFKGHVRRILD